ncbi:MAG: tetratricopeptide repeat protein [Bryobacteraceae bacterium]
MKSSRKKWILFSAFLVLIGLGSAFLLKLNSVSETPEVASRAKPAPPPPENLEHELKELGVQLQKKPGHTPVLMRMAQIEREKGKLDDAAIHLREVVHNEPENAEAHLELGRDLYEKGDLNGGITETEAVLKINPKQVDALYNLGAIYANLGNAERARSYWTRAIQADPNAESGRKARDGLTKIGGI